MTFKLSDWIESNHGLLAWALFMGSVMALFFGLMQAVLIPQVPVGGWKILAAGQLEAFAYWILELLGLAFIVIHLALKPIIRFSLILTGTAPEELEEFMDAVERRGKRK